MALFSKKTEKSAQGGSSSGGKAATPSVKEASSQSAGTPALRSLGGGWDLSHVLKHVRITEKASMQQGMNVYTFDVAQSATKRDIMLAIRALYKVTPRKVAVVNVPTKTRKNMRTGREGLKRGGKKAYVYLKSGETITAA